MALWPIELAGHYSPSQHVCLQSPVYLLFTGGSPVVFLVIVILRIICRTILVRGGGKRGNLGLDDYITIFCIVILLLTCILVNIGSQHGLGRRMHTLEPPQRIEALKWNVIISSILIWSFSLPKFAIIAILKRILNYGLKTSIMFWGLALSSQACILATSVWWFVQCRPVEYGWDRSIDGGSCAPISVLANLGYFTSAYSAFLDLFFALYPIPFIKRLKMPLKSRIAVSIALGLSSLACIVSIYKLAIFGEIFAILEVDPTCKLLPHETTVSSWILTMLKLQILCHTWIF